MAGYVNKTLSVGTSVRSSALGVNSSAGTSGGWSTPHFRFYLDVKLNSQNVTNNTSNVTVMLLGQAVNDYWSGTSITYTLELSKGTSPVTASFSGFSYSEYNSGTIKTIVSTTQNISHNSDGTCTFTINGTGPGNSGNIHAPNSFNFYNSGLGFNITLPTIARASTLSGPNAYSVSSTSTSTGLTLTIEPKASYYHKLVWKIGSTTIKTSNITTAHDSDFTELIKDSELLAAISTSSATVTAALSTYSNSGLTTQIGSTVTKDIGVTINTSEIKPTVSGVAITGVAALGNISASNLVAGYSRPKVTWTSTVPTNTTYTVSVSITSTTAGIPAIEESKSNQTSPYSLTSTLPSSTSADYNITAKVTITDSRGGTASATSSSKTVYRYAGITSDLSAYRIASNSTSAAADPAGVYVKITYSGSSSTIPSTGTNQNTVTVTCKWGTTTISSSPSIQSLRATSTQIATLTVTDQLSTITKTVTVPRAQYPLDLYDDSAGSIGVGLGTMADPGFVKTELPTKGFFLYGTCATASATAKKVVSDIPQFTSSYLVAGTTVFIKFAHSNGVSNPTLTINGVAEKNIYKHATNSPGTHYYDSWVDGSVVCLVYDGSRWEQVGYLNSTYDEISESNITNTTGSTAGLISGRRFKAGFDANMAAYHNIAWFKLNASAGIGVNSNTSPPWFLNKQIGSGFTQTSGGGNIICNKAGTVRISAKIFIWADSSSYNMGGATVYIRQNGVNNDATKTTVSWFSNTDIYDEAILDVSVNDVLNVNVQNASSVGLYVQSSSSIIVEYI